MAVLVLADHDLGALSPGVARVVAAAQLLGPVDVLVTDAGVALQAARLAGIGKVLVAQSEPFAESLAPLLASLADRYTHIVAASSATGRDVIPRLAAKLDLMPVTDVVAIESPTRFVRPVYAGNALETVTDSQPKHLLTVRPSAFRPVATGNAAPIEAVAPAPTPRAAFVAAHRSKSDTPDLSTSQVVVSGGVSVGSAVGFRLVEQLAAKLNAAVGATRAAVDAGYAPNDWQVGQTGKIIAPDLYVAIGISGALQHLAGIQGAKKIVAINTDPDAPLSKLADYLLVADLFTAVPELIAALDKR